MKLMAKRPGDRYQTPTELISDLVMLAEVENLPRINRRERCWFPITVHFIA
ncbi:MAG: hypothetical protein R3C56_07160 [Pirellulaceae bacterium]